MVSFFSGSSGVFRVTTRRFQASNSMCGFGVFRWIVGGTARCCRHNSAFAMPATPEAVSRWPILLLTDPISSGAPLGRFCPSSNPS